MKKFLRKKQYSKKDFFKNSKKESFGHHKKVIKIFWIIITILITIGLIYLLIYSPVFKIKKVVITNTQEIEVINKIQIISQRFTEGRKFFILPKNNIILLSKEELKTEINSKIILEKLVINKKLFNTLKIEAKEKIPILLWQEKNENYYIDKHGMVMGFIEQDKIKYDLPIINKGTTTQIIVGTRILEPDNIEFIQHVLEKIKAKFKKWQISKITAQDVDNQEINFFTNENWYIILNTESDIDKQLNNLKKLLDQKIQERTELKYIDLRILDRIFYK